MAFFLQRTLTAMFDIVKNQEKELNLAKAVNGVPPPGTDYLQGTLTFTGC